MQKDTVKLNTDDTVFVGTDIHQRSGYVTMRTTEVELFSGSIAGTWEDLRMKLYAPYLDTESRRNSHACAADSRFLKPQQPQAVQDNKHRHTDIGEDSERKATDAENC